MQAASRLAKNHRTAAGRIGLSFTVFAVVLAVILSVMPAGAQYQSLGAISYTPVLDQPVNPELIKYYEQHPSGVGTGYVPTVLDFSYLEGMPVSDGMVRAMDLPSSYMVDVSSVKDQTYFGTCWAFSTYGSLESTLLESGDAVESDFSEKNLVNRAGFDADPGLGVENTGGNFIMSTAYLARWAGPVAEADDPYPTGHTWSSSSPGMIQRHVQDVYFIPGITSASDLSGIKSALMDFGAVYTSINTSANATGVPFKWNYNPAYFAYYNPDPNNVTDHAVTIVGWDDNFDQNNFTPAAPGPGAFIVKNSWGTNWGNSGYFYVSYYDAKVARSNAVFLAEPTSGTDNIYQYDMLGLVGWGGFSYSDPDHTPTESNWFANAFTASGDELVTSISFYARYPGMQYTANVYTNPSAGNPSSGSLESTQSGTVAYPGYNTIDLPVPVEVSAGHNFSVAVHLTNPMIDYDTYYSRNLPHCWASDLARTTGATGVPDVGYISYDGDEWFEITTGYGIPTMTNCLKAFTQDASIPILRFQDTSYTVNEDDGTVTLTVDRLGNLSGPVAVDYYTTDGTAVNGTNYIASSSTLVIGSSESNGTFDITIRDDGLYSGGSKDFTVTLSSPVNAVLLPGYTQATVHITNTDPAPVIYLESNMGHAFEANGNFSVGIFRSNDSEGPVSVNWDLGSGNPQMTPCSGTVVFNTHEFTKTVIIPLADDHVYVNGSTCPFYLSTPTGGAALGNPSQMTVYWTDMDPAPVVQFSDGNYSAAENDVQATVTVTRTNDAWNDVTVDYSTADATARQPTDYTATTGTLTFGKGEFSKTFTVPVHSDGIWGDDKFFAVQLSNGSYGATIGSPGAAMVHVLEDDTPPAFGFNLTYYEALESSGVVLFNVTRSVDSTIPVTVHLETYNITALADVNYAPIDTDVTFGPGAMEIPYGTMIIHDGSMLGDTTFGLAMSDPRPSGTTLGTNATATVKIIETDSPPGVSLDTDSYGIAEYAGVIDTMLGVHRQGSPLTPFTVDYTIGQAGDTAVAGTDYEAVPGTPLHGTLSFAAGEDHKYIPINITGDDMYGPNKAFNITINDPVDATLGTNTVSCVTIYEGDPYPTVGLDKDAYYVDESNGSVSINVTRANDAVGDVTVDYATHDGLALEGEDYSNTTGTLTFRQGEMEKAFSVPILSDGLFEFQESFVVELHYPVGAGITRNNALVFINDTDPAPVLQFSSGAYDADEDAGSVTLTVTRTGDAENPVTVDYSFSDGTAVAGTNYDNTPGFLNFNKGVMSQTVTVPILDDGVAASGLTFDVNMGAAHSIPEGAIIGTPASATVTINDKTVFTVKLKEGWNLVSFPVVNFSIKASDLGGIGVTDVAAYNSTSQSYDEYYNMSFSSSSYDFTLRPDCGYFIKCNRDTSFEVIGNLPVDRSASLCNGWNLVGWSTYDDSLASSIVALLPNDQVVARFDAVNQSFDVYIEGLSTATYDFAMQPGWGYFINSTGPATLYYGVI